MPPQHRDTVLWELQQRGVGVAVNYRACHLYSLFRNRYGHKEGDLPEAERLGSRTLSLPLFAGLQPTEVEYVADTVQKVVRSLV